MKFFLSYNECLSTPFGRSCKFKWHKMISLELDTSFGVWLWEKMLEFEGGRQGLATSAI